MKQKYLLPYLSCTFLPPPHYKKNFKKGRAPYMTPTPLMIRFTFKKAFFS